MPESASMPDEDLCALLQQHFHIDGRSAFLEGNTRPAGQKSQDRLLHGAPGQPAVILDEFVANMLVLLDMEHDAEKAQVGLSHPHLLFRLVLALRCASLCQGFCWKYACVKTVPESAWVLDSSGPGGHCTGAA